MIDGIVSENDPKLVLEEDDFNPDVDYTVLIRERTRGSKLEGTFKKKTAQPIGESVHTVTILPSRGSPVVLSQRDIAIERKEANNPGPSKRKYRKMKLAAVKKECQNKSTCQIVKKCQMRPNCQLRKRY